mmetsp:Transcript_18617/g.47695  ORF Transcript_18617/g.47695 Transcript_18617/m.47695 type:complete len:212 (+) Transcript_18617:3378-4013(+)
MRGPPPPPQSPAWRHPRASRPSWAPQAPRLAPSPRGTTSPAAGLHPPGCAPSPPRGRLVPCAAHDGQEGPEPWQGYQRRQLRVHGEETAAGQLSMQLFAAGRGASAALMPAATRGAAPWKRWRQPTPWEALPFELRPGMPLRRRLPACQPARRGLAPTQPAGCAPAQNHATRALRRTDPCCSRPADPEHRCRGPQTGTPPQTGCRTPPGFG